MSELIDIATKIIQLLQAGLTNVEVRYGLAASTGVITASKAVGVCILSKKEEAVAVGANQQIITYQIWAYAKLSPPSTPADAEKEVISLMEQVEDILRANPHLDGLVMDSELSETNYNYEEIQAGIYAATAVLNLTVWRLKNL
ncbi:MAG: hypothetical protein ACPLPW_08200 [bacterium]